MNRMLELRLKIQGRPVECMLRLGAFTHIEDNIGAYAFENTVGVGETYQIVLCTGVNVGAIVTDVEVSGVSLLEVDGEVERSLGTSPFSYPPGRCLWEILGNPPTAALHVPAGRMIPIMIRFDRADSSPRAELSPYVSGVIEHEQQVLNAINTGTPISFYNWMGEYSLGFPILGHADTAGAAGGSGIMPDHSTKLGCVDRMLAHMAMNRNAVCSVDVEGVPIREDARTTLAYGPTLRATWAPFATEHAVDTWYSEFRPTGIPLDTRLAVPDDGQHYCRAFGPALAAWRSTRDPASLLFLVCLAQNVLSAYNFSRMRQLMLSQTKGQLGREFGWVSFFMASMSEVLKDIYILSHRPKFLPVGLQRDIGNWLMLASAIYTNQQLPSGAWQALTYPSPGMSPDPWEVDGVPKAYAVAQGIEHAILCVGCAAVHRAVGSLQRNLARAVWVYVVSGNPDAHWFGVGEIDKDKRFTPWPAIIPLSYGHPNATNIPWAMAAGALGGVPDCVDYVKAFPRGTHQIYRYVDNVSLHLPRTR